MPAHFGNIDRATPLLLPPDLRDWIPPNHLAHFLIDAVEVIPEAAGHINWRGSGSEQYPPRMMLAVPPALSEVEAAHLRRRDRVLEVRARSSGRLTATPIALCLSPPARP